MKGLKLETAPVSMVREIPIFKGVPSSPTSFKNLKPKHEYGEIIHVPFPNNLAVLFLEFYQRKTEHWEHVCNHYPSCSEYARISFLRYGFPSAFFLSFEHLRECSDPFSNWPRMIKP